MSVSITGTLGGGQPDASQFVWVPLGGDGKAAPLGCYVARIEVVGDASGGVATAGIIGDDRYTSIAAWLSFEVEVAAAAPDFQIRMLNDLTASQPQVLIVGTAPHVATTVAVVNSTFLWYPPPMLYPRGGFWEVRCLNIGAGETYRLTAEVFVFDADIRQIMPLPDLQANFPGVSAPAAI